MFPMLCIQVGDTVGVSRHSDATMHVYINHRDLGPVCSNVSEVSDTRITVNSDTCSYTENYNNYCACN